MLENIKDNSITEFNQEVKDKLTFLALDVVQDMQQTFDENKLDTDVNFVTEMFDFIGLENVEYEHGEITATTASPDIMRIANEQLEETNVQFQIEVVSGLDEIEDIYDGQEFDDEIDDGIEVSENEIDIDTYIAESGDVFVITVFMKAINEAGNPFKRDSQKVIRGGKRVRKLVKNKRKGFRRGSDGKTKKQTSSEKIRRKRGSRKAVRTNKGKKAARVRKFKRSIKKSKKITNRAKRRT